MTIETPEQRRAGCESGNSPTDATIQACGFTDGKVMVEFIVGGSTVWTGVASFATWRNWATAVLGTCDKTEQEIENGAGQTRQ